MPSAPGKVLTETGSSVMPALDKDFTTSTAPSSSLSRLIVAIAAANGTPAIQNEPVANTEAAVFRTHCYPGGR